MRLVRGIIVIGFGVTMFGCIPFLVPMPMGRTQPSGVVVSSECITFEKETTVQILIRSTVGDSTWRAEFLGGQPEGLQVETGSAVTTLRWKLGSDHSREAGIKPYEITLKTGNKSYKAIIKFRITPDRLTASFVDSVTRTN